MKKIKAFMLLIKKELALCIAVPIITAVLLHTGVTQNPNHLPLIIMGLFCAFAYGIAKMFFTPKKDDAILNLNFRSLIQAVNSTWKLIELR